MKTQGSQSFSARRLGAVAAVAFALVATSLTIGAQAAETPKFGKACTTEGASTGLSTNSLICQKGANGKLTWQRVRLAGSNYSPVPALKAAPGSIEFHHWRSEDKEYFNKIIKDYQDANPGVTITQTIMDSTSYQNLELSKAQANPKAALVAVFRGQQFSDFAKANMMRELTNERFIKQNVIKTAFTPATIDGKIYGLPYHTLLNNPLYNTEMFAKNGWKLPKNWTEVLAFCKTAKAKGVIPFAWPAATKGNAGQIMNSFMMNSDSSLAAITKHVNDIQAGKELVTDSWFKSIATKYKQMNDAGCFPDNVAGYNDTAAPADFAAGKAAIYPTGSFAMGTVTKLNPDMKGKIGIFGLITTDGKPTFEGITNNTFILTINPKASSRDQNIARSFMSYLATSQVAQYYGTSSSQHTSIVNADYSANVDLLNTSPIMSKNLVLAPRFLFTNGGVSNAVELALIAIGSGKDVDATLADAAKQIKTALGV